MLEVRWYGHSMWRVSNRDVTIVMDPFSNIGYPMPQDLVADVVLVSHDHFDHNNVALVKGRPTVLRTAGTHHEKGVEFDLVPVWHDEQKGARRGANLLMRFDLEGRRFVHCGDLGHIPSREIIERLGRVDVLFVPVGGTYTIDAAGAAEVARLLNPTIVFPMHYHTSVRSGDLDTAEAFVRHAGNGRLVEDNHIDLTEADFARQQTILLGFR